MLDGCDGLRSVDVSTIWKEFVESVPTVPSASSSSSLERSSSSPAPRSFWIVADVRRCSDHKHIQGSQGDSNTARFMPQPMAHPNATILCCNGARACRTAVTGTGITAVSRRWARRLICSRCLRVAPNAPFARPPFCHIIHVPMTAGALPADDRSCCIAQGSISSCCIPRCVLCDMQASKEATQVTKNSFCGAAALVPCPLRQLWVVW
jgi:hypothetical protein